MKISFFASEVVPFAKTGGLADVSGALPLALEELGNDVCIFLPKYKCINSQDFDIKRLNNFVSTTVIGNNIQIYFIENDDLYNREGIYGDSKGSFVDNLERFRFFCIKSLEILKLLNFKADIVHCNDWHTALIPVYLKTVFGKDPFYKKMKTIFTIHNLAYQGIFPEDQFSTLNLEEKLYSNNGFEFFGQINLMKGGVIFSDVVTTVSEQYAEEIQTEEFGCGLDKVLKSRHVSVVGILNGLDYSIWNPETDDFLEHKYSNKNIDGKFKNKSKLQKICNLPIKKDIPILGLVGRLSHQKGIDLIIESIDNLAQQDVQIIILGTGEEKYHELLKSKASLYPDKVSVHLYFDEKMAHQIYAGSDIFLMPSIFEPCGLSQMISLKYGTIPLVSHTGGLVDTIVPYEQQGNGFMFKEHTKSSFLGTVEQAVNVYHNASNFMELRAKAFNYSFSWKDSAKQYLGLYNQCMLWNS